MPKPEPPVATEQEMHDWLKSRGHNLDQPNAPPAAPAGQAGEAAAATGGSSAPGMLEQLHSMVAGDIQPGRPVSYEDMDWQQAAGQGAARRAAQLGVGAAHLAGQVLPTSVRSTLGSAAERIPGVRRLEDFASAEPEGPAELIGGGAMDIATGGMLPSLGLGARAAAMVPKTITGSVTPGAITPIWNAGQWVARAGTPTVNFAVKNYPRATKAARFAGDIAESAAKGALGGAVASPDDPATGAVAGAVGSGVAGPVVGGALRSAPAQYFAGKLGTYAPEVAFGALSGSHYGLPGAVGGGGLAGLASHAIRAAARRSAHAHYSPLGRSLENFGKAVFDSAGRFLGYLPGTVGIESGRAVTEGQPTFAPRATMPPEEGPNAQPGPAER
jgi:hypothetical protein